jgi:hypothetical protein
MTNANYRKLTAGLIGAWFIFSLSASGLNVFRNDSDRLVLPLLLAAIGPIMLFFSWFASSPAFRQFVRSLSPHALTMAQTWRITGFVFIILNVYGLLPGVFAVPAGLGDMAIGATAPLIARRLVNANKRRGFILWQVLGISDLLMAVTLGATARLIGGHGIRMAAMTVLPLSLVPSFIVPLLLVFHVICIAQAVRWPRQQYSRLGEGLPSSAI